MTKKSKPSKMGFCEGFTIVASTFLLALLMKNSRLVSAEVSKALKTCATLLVPSLFPLTVASEIAASTGALDKITRGLQGLVSKILGIKKIASAPYFLGIVGGYTTSCKSAVALLQNGKIDKEDCKSVIAMSNMPSLAFLTGFVGTEILGSATDGWILWGITVLSTLVLGAFHKLSCEKINPSLKEQPRAVTAIQGKKLSKTVVDAVSHSAQAMLLLCGFVVFFLVLIRVLEITLLRINVPIEARRLILGALEITYGVSSCKQIQNELMRRVLCAFFVGWSGLCVHFQVIALYEDANLSFKGYFGLKLLQGGICALLALLIFGLKFLAA